MTEALGFRIWRAGSRDCNEHLMSIGLTGKESVVRVLDFVERYDGLSKPCN